MGGSWKQARARGEQHEQWQHRFRQFLQGIRTWHLVLILIPLLFMSATFLRFDHLGMNELKQAVIDADKTTEVKNADGTTAQLTYDEIKQNINTALDNLKNYTDTHIVVNFLEHNGTSTLFFGTGPIYLENQYHRDASIAIAAAEQQLNANPAAMENPNGNVFGLAYNVCRPLAFQNGWVTESPEYINCYVTEINKYPASDRLTSSVVADIPSTALYRYDFISPVWTPGPAGWTILVCLILIVIIVIRLITWLILRIALLVVK